MVALKRNDPPRKEWVQDILMFDLKTMELIEKVGTRDNYYYNFELAQNANFMRVESEYKILNTPDQPINYSYIWDTKLRKIIKQNDNIGNFQTSPDGKWIGSVSLNKVSLFDAQSYKKVWETNQGGGGILTGVTFSPDSRYMATCGATGGNDMNDIRIPDLKIGETSYRYSNNTRKSLAQDYLVFSPKNKYLMGWMDAGIILYNAFYTTTKVDQVISSDTNIVSPNPATHKISINDVGLNYSVKLYSETGIDIDVSTILNINNNKLDIDVSILLIGTYYVVVSQNSISKLYKFIKE